MQKYQRSVSEAEDADRSSVITSPPASASPESRVRLHLRLVLRLCPRALVIGELELQETVRV